MILKESNSNRAEQIEKAILRDCGKDDVTIDPNTLSELALWTNVQKNVNGTSTYLQCTASNDNQSWECQCSDK